MYNQVHQNLINYQKIRNNRQHPKSKLRIFKEGDIVYLDNPGRFRRSWDGPYQVLKRYTDVNYEIQYLEDKKAPTQKIHVNRLKLAPARKGHLQESTEDTTNTERVEETAPLILDKITQNTPTLVILDTPLHNINNNKLNNIPYFLRPRKKQT